MSSTLHPYDSNPTRPYGILPDAPPALAVDRPPLPIISAINGEKLRVDQDLTELVPPWWLRSQTKPPTGHRISESYLLAYIVELTRVHANQWLDKDGEVVKAQAATKSALHTADLLRAALETKTGIIKSLRQQVAAK